MEFFEAHYPYYASIKARDEDEAVQLYVMYIADDEDGTLREEMKEVERDYALVMYTKAMSLEHNRISVEYILNDFRDDEPSVLLIDCSLA